MRKLYLVVIIALFSASTASPACADYAEREGQAIVIYPGDAPEEEAPPPPPAPAWSGGGVQSHSPDYYLNSSHLQINGCNSCNLQNHRWSHVQVDFPHR